MNDSKITTKMSLKMNVYTTSIKFPYFISFFNSNFIGIKRYSDLKIIILNTSNSQIYIIKQFNNHDACE